MKKGIAIYSEGMLVIDDHVWQIGGREATYLGAYGLTLGRGATMTANKTWGKRCAIGDLDDHARMLFAALMKQVCINPSMTATLELGDKVRLR